MRSSECQGSHQEASCGARDELLNRGSQVRILSPALFVQAWEHVRARAQRKENVPHSWWLGGSASTTEDRARKALALAEKAKDELKGLDASVWLDRVEDQSSEIDSALSWFLDHGSGDDALGMAVALYDFWRLTGRTADGQSWIDRALAAGGNDDRLRAEGLYRSGLLAFWQGHDESARLSHERSLEIARRLNDPTAIAVALAGLARLELRQGNLDEARSLCTQALQAVEGTDDKDGRSNALHVLAVTAQMRGDLEEARDRMTQRMRLAREQGSFGGVAVEACNLSHVERRLGNLARARQLAVEALQIARRRGDEWMFPYALSALAACAIDLQQFRRAAELLGSAAQMVESQGAAWPPDEAPIFEHSKEAASHALGPAVFGAAWSAGRAIPVSAAVDYALAGELGVGVNQGQSPSPGA